MGPFFGAGLERAWQRRFTAGKDRSYWYFSELPYRCYWMLTIVLHAVSPEYNAPDAPDEDDAVRARGSGSADNPFYFDDDEDKE